MSQYSDLNPLTAGPEYVRFFFVCINTLTSAKKTTLDKNERKNYRPVSNLSFISKILEKVVASRLLSHMESNSISNNLQSEVKKFHSTESALLKVENDVLLNMAI